MRCRTELGRSSQRCCMFSSIHIQFIFGQYGTQSKCRHSTSSTDGFSENIGKNTKHKRRKYLPTGKRNTRNTGKVGTITEILNDKLQKLDVELREFKGVVYHLVDCNGHLAQTLSSCRQLQEYISYFSPSYHRTHKSNRIVPPCTFTK